MTRPDPRRLVLRALALTATAPWALAGCAGPTVADHANERPVLDLQRYFNGHLLAHGMFLDRSGKVARRFVVRLQGRWSGADGVLDEQFEYSDGRRERRVWRLKKLDGGRYSGTADDVVGEAQGKSAGNALQWRYTLRLPVDDQVYDVDFDDWMVLIDERVMLNRAVMSKYGIRLGEVQLSFTKL